MPKTASATPSFWPEGLKIKRSLNLTVYLVLAGKPVPVTVTVSPTKIVSEVVGTTDIWLVTVKLTSLLPSLIVCRPLGFAGTVKVAVASDEPFPELIVSISTPENCNDPPEKSRLTVTFTEVPTGPVIGVTWIIGLASLPCKDQDNVLPVRSSFVCV